MADFRGYLSGTGHCSRLGSAQTGLSAEVGGWQGMVTVKCWRDLTTGKDWATVRLEPVKGRGVSRFLWEGPLDGSGLAPEEG